MKKILIATICLALVAGVAVVLAKTGTDPETVDNVKTTGNSAPSGPHYNLNIIGVSKEKSADMDNNSGHRIFVSLGAKNNAANTKILLCESGVGEACIDVEGYQVLDANGTDGEASFALPNPDPENTGVSEYSVYARALGKPGGKADMTTCALDPVTKEPICSVAVFSVERGKGKSSFQNVTKYLLYIYVDLDEDGKAEHYNLFADELQDYFWQYDNQGLKVLQLRFYPISTEVPDYME